MPLIKLTSAAMFINIAGLVMAKTLHRCIPSQSAYRFEKFNESVLILYSLAAASNAGTPCRHLVANHAQMVIILIRFLK